MREKRRGKRFEMVQVNGHLLGKADVRVLDLSLSGIAVEAASRLRVNRRYALSLDGPKRSTGRIVGRVVWCYLSGTRREPSGDVQPVFRAGIEFEGSSESDLKRLAELIEHNAWLELERWFEGKFTVSTHEGISVFLEYVFRLVRISRHGMVVEVDLVPEAGSEFAMVLNLDSGSCRVTGRIVSVESTRRSTGELTHLMAVEFVDLEESDRLFLDEFIAREIDTGLKGEL